MIINLKKNIEDLSKIFDILELENKEQLYKELVESCIALAISRVCEHNEALKNKLKNTNIKDLTPESLMLMVASFDLNVKEDFAKELNLLFTEYVTLVTKTLNNDKKEQIFQLWSANMS